MKFSLRKAQEKDIDFLLSLRMETMTAYLKGVGLPTDADAHIDRIRYHFDSARIVCLGEKRIGLFKYRSDKNGYDIIQIQILPAHQKQGLGEKLIGKILEQSHLEGKPVSLHVLTSNPAMKLYKRLGFRISGKDNHGFIMVYPIIA